MPRGQGKYDDVAELALKAAEAQGVAVLVYRGKLGDGFSVKMDLVAVRALPGVLRSIANAIEADIQSDGN